MSASACWLLGIGAAQAVALSCIMAFAWLVQRRTGNSGWIDAVWTFGLGSVGVISALAPLQTNTGPTDRQLLVAALVALWAMRLGWHIVQRSRSKDDDPRYAELIRGWGEDAGRQLFVLLQKHALVSIPLAFAMLLAAHNTVPELRPQDWLAVAIFAIAIAGEALSDRQLRSFRSDPRNAGRVCEAGLWSVSRHPNYFFEWVHWLVYPLIAIDLSGNYPWGWAALAAPVCMYWLLSYVSGVPPLEEHMVRRHGDRYRAYQQRTSAFFPGF
jgi:steroid 5-alpha reductase family enzyme